MSVHGAAEERLRWRTLAELDLIHHRGRTFIKAWDALKLKLITFPRKVVSLQQVDITLQVAWSLQPRVLARWWTWGTPPPGKEATPDITARRFTHYEIIRCALIDTWEMRSSLYWDCTEPCRWTWRQWEGAVTTDPDWKGLICHRGRMFTVANAPDLQNLLPLPGNFLTSVNNMTHQVAWRLQPRQRKRRTPPPRRKQELSWR